MVLLIAPPAYLYGQYNNDPDIQATRDAYNQEAQYIFNWLQTNPIADYRGDPISGPLLDFVAQGLYNMTRRVQVASTLGGVKGSFGDAAFGTSEFAGGTYQEPDSQAISLSDDQFRRAITWNIFSGDGWTFSTNWLRRRIARFIFGVDGASDINVDDQQLISIMWTSLRTATVYVTSPASSATLTGLLLIGISNNYLQTPIGYDIIIVALNFQTSMTDFGGDIL